ncbi:MAG: hypothetical protein J4N94_05765, partial [Chloroflexi bacterium]|nr:hypothetical protein [Chloroflexota bacterium]
RSEEATMALDDVVRRFGGEENARPVATFRDFSSPSAAGGREGGASQAAISDVINDAVSNFALESTDQDVGAAGATKVLNRVLQGIRSSLYESD